MSWPLRWHCRWVAAVGAVRLKIEEAVPMPTRTNVSESEMRFPRDRHRGPYSSPRSSGLRNPSDRPEVENRAQHRGTSTNQDPLSMGAE